MKNKLIDLNNHLFFQMERLMDEELNDEGLIREINRSKSVSNMAAQIINNANLALKASVAINDGLLKEPPKMLGLNGYKDED
ncbi:hypothetical protein LCGC14_0777900 [marine sediment metagenome]|uniref:Phage protein n=1 Tax=marine sediment metagenome TaxID=412755 RepID=A0A0F9T3E7_9ZZZZ|nr:hypothetical protein [Desulfobacterales bacterium]